MMPVDTVNADDEVLAGAPSFQLMGIPDVSERARAELGDEHYEAAVARGRSASLEEVIALALEGSTA